MLSLHNTKYDFHLITFAINSWIYAGSTGTRLAVGIFACSVEALNWDDLLPTKRSYLSQWRTVFLQRRPGFDHSQVHVEFVVNEEALGKVSFSQYVGFPLPPMPLCPPQILHAIACYRSRTSWVEGQRLNASATAESCLRTNFMYEIFMNWVQRNCKRWVITTKAEQGSLCRGIASVCGENCVKCRFL